jgi:hypothetical protein
MTCLGLRAGCAERVDVLAFKCRAVSRLMTGGETSLQSGAASYRVEARAGTPLSGVAPPLSARLLVLDHPAG